jgi:DNA-binding protein HU-beta
MIPELESLGPQMNQSELIEKVAQATELNQAAVGQTVKAVVNAILDALVAGDAVRVSGLGSFDVAARPAREGRNPQTGEASKSQPARQYGSAQARSSRTRSIRRLQRQLPGRRPYHPRTPQRGSRSKCPFATRVRALGSCALVDPPVRHRIHLIRRQDASERVSRGTKSSNPACSSGESANPRYLSRRIIAGG